MSKKEIVEAVNQAFLAQDEDVLRRHLVPHYKYRGPMEPMNLDGLEACLTLMKSFALKPENANSKWVCEDHRVVEIFDWTLREPVEAVVPMVEVTEFEGDQIASTTAYFDPALFPSF